MLSNNLNKNKIFIWNILSLTIFFIIWEVASDFNLMNSNFIPAPAVIIRTMYQGLKSGLLFSDIVSSLRRVIIGFIIGSFLGFSFGLLCALNKLMGYIFKPIFELVRPIPPTAWIPLSILWFGFGEPSAFFLVSLGAFFPIFSNTFLGLAQVNKGTLDVAACHGASQELLFWKIILPQALPSIFSGLRTGLGVSWMIVITAELVGVQSGLGYFIQISRAQLQTEQVIAGMFIIGFIGLILNWILSYIAKKIMPWVWRDEKIGFNE